MGLAAPGIAERQHVFAPVQKLAFNKVFVTNATFGGRRFRLKFDNAFSAGMRDWLQQPLDPLLLAILALARDQL